MLPPKFKLNNLDDEIRELVININRIPGVYTNTTCEGHVVESEYSIVPTARGCFHFGRSRNMHEGLITHLDPFFVNRPYFEFVKSTPEKSQETVSYIIFAQFPLDKDTEDGYESLSVEKRKQLLDECKKWKREKIDLGWKNLNEIVLDYIRTNLTPDVESLPFIEEGEAPRPFMMCRW